MSAAAPKKKEKKLVQVWIPARTHRAVAKLAAAGGESLAGFIRRLITGLLSERPLAHRAHAIVAAAPDIAAWAPLDERKFCGCGGFYDEALGAYVHAERCARVRPPVGPSIIDDEPRR